MSINEALKVLVDRGVDEETLKQVVLALGDVSQDVVKAKTEYHIEVITGFDTGTYEATQRYEDVLLDYLYYDFGLIRIVNAGFSGDNSKLFKTEIAYINEGDKIYLQNGISMIEADKLYKQMNKIYKKGKWLDLHIIDQNGDELVMYDGQSRVNRKRPA